MHPHNQTVTCTCLWNELLNGFSIYQHFSHYSITLSLCKNHRQEWNNEIKVEKYTMDIWENCVLSLEALSKLTRSQSYLTNWVHKLRIPNKFWQWGTKSLSLNIKESFKKTLNLVPNKLFPKRRQVKHIKKIPNFKKAEFLEEQFHSLKLYCHHLFREQTASGFSSKQSSRLQTGVC